VRFARIAKRLVAACDVKVRVRAGDGRVRSLELLERNRKLLLLERIFALLEMLRRFFRAGVRPASRGVARRRAFPSAFRMRLGGRGCGVERGGAGKHERT